MVCGLSTDVDNLGAGRMRQGDAALGGEEPLLGIAELDAVEGEAAFGGHTSPDL